MTGRRFFDSTTHSLPPAAAHRVLDCDINFKKADSPSCLFAHAGLGQWSVCDISRSSKSEDRFVQSGK
ncbi:hypothetical protein [Azospirillum sp. B510]|uniref:hypothetical protein n=1 Tax=Azospirillum sp. (strain B510) TaxID=137722 RepID=UPI0011D074D0|nr:hypothetical protein [Azospirillum sp. B510]